MFRLFPIFIFSMALVTLTACKQAGESDDRAQDEPKTSYGRQVRDARDLQAENDERNEEIADQAADLFEEE